MTAHRPATILEQALELPEAHRPDFIRQACGEDATLRAEVESLLRAHEDAGEFLAVPDTKLDETSANNSQERVGSVIGHYKLLQVIGEGGFGTVYMAEQTEPVRRRVALKVVKPGMETRQVLARFEAERQALAMMDHPNIASVFDGGATDSGRPYFVMELVRGVPITEYCDANKLDTRERLEVMIDVAGAVQHAHQKGVIHRDLKPTNVLVTTLDGRPIPKVIDFGIAKAMSSPLTDKTLFTEFRQMIGTPEYMSPEQAEMSAIDIDTRTDIYSLGVLLYELLTGAPPLDGDELRKAGLIEMRRVICEVDPPRPSMKLSTLGDQLATVARSRSTEPSGLSHVLRGDLDWVVMRTLEKDRGRRYASAGELADDLRRYLRDEPVTAAPPSVAYRLRKLIRRNRAPVLASAGVLAAIVIAGIVAVAFAIQANVNLNDARKANRLAKIETERAEEAAALADARASENERLLYALSIRAVEVAIRNGNVDEACRILDACPEEQVGWEWTWLDQAARDRGREIGRHTANGIRDVEYSPDGHLLVSAGYDGLVRVWDVNTETLLYDLAGHQDIVTGASFSPDGKHLATCGADRVVILWDLSSGQRKMTLEGHDSWLSAVAFSPNGDMLASAGGDSNLRIWDATDGFRLIHELRGYEHDIWSIDFNPDGSRLATCTGDGAVVVWDVEAGERVLERDVSNFGTWSIRYNPDGSRLVTAGFDNRASVWNAETGEFIFDLRGYNLPVRVAEYSPDGTLIVTGGFGGVRSFDAETGDLAAVAVRSQGDLHALDFHPSGQSFAIGGIAKPEIRLWSTAFVAGPLELIGHNALVLETVADPSGRVIYSASDDGSLRSWDGLTGALRWTRFAIRDRFYSLDLTPDGRTLVTAGHGGWLRAWNATSGDERWARRFGGNARNVIVSPDGTTFAAGASRDALPESYTGSFAALWNIEDGTQLRLLEGHTGALSRMAFDSTGDRLATTSKDGSVRIWNTNAGTTEHILREVSVGTPNAVDFAPDGARAIVGHTDGRLAMWDIEQEQVIWSAQAHNSTIGSVRFSKDGSRVLTSAWHNPEVRIWLAASGEMLLELNTQTTGLSDASFLPDDAGIITAGMEGKLKVWELEPRTEAHPLRMSTRVLAVRERETQQRVANELAPALANARDLRLEWQPEDAAAIMRDARELAERTLPEGHPLRRQVEREVAWTDQLIELKKTPVSLADEQLATFVGRYGPVQVRVDDGRLVLTHDDYPATQVLRPLTARTFQSTTYDWLRVEFEQSNNEPATAITGVYLSGTVLSYPREGSPDARQP